MRKKAPAKKGLTASTADKFALYERSVQAPDNEVAFLDRVFRKTRGRRPLALREDFCGTGALCAAWAKSHLERTAIGLDLDGKTLAYGQSHHVSALGPASHRVELCRRDVLTAGPEKVEIIAAFNFSYCVFKERAELLRYFRRAHAALVDDGVFVLDVYGGLDCQSELIERKRLPGFTYVWEQGPTDAIKGEAMRYIHFEFRDGSTLHRAFTYDWRIWSLPELCDALADAGFTRVEVYWESSDKRGRGDGKFKKRDAAVNEQAWIAYILAWR